MSKCAKVEDALAFVREHGVVLASAKGTVPRLTEAIVGALIQGNWWGHPQSHSIYAIPEAVTASSQVLVCRLINGKITLVHRRLWPALVSLAPRFAPEQLKSGLMTKVARQRLAHLRADEVTALKTCLDQRVP